MVDWHALPSLTSLRAFEATARHGTFAGAARALNVTHAAISQQVRALEGDLGVQLAIRQGRFVQLTEEGRTLAARLSDGFAAIADGVERLRDARASRGLRVTTTPFLTERIIMPRLFEFWKAHPGSEISMHLSRAFVEMPLEGFDLAIRATTEGRRIDVKGTDRVFMGTIRLIALASPDLVARRGNRAQALPWLWHEEMGTKIDMMRDSGLDIDTLERANIGSANLMLEATRQGIGVTIFNEQIARQEIDAGGLVEIELPREAIGEYHALMPKGMRHPLAEPFYKWVQTLI